MGYLQSRTLLLRKRIRINKLHLRLPNLNIKRRIQPPLTQNRRRSVIHILGSLLARGAHLDNRWCKTRNNKALDLGFFRDVETEWMAYETEMRIEEAAIELGL